MKIFYTIQKYVFRFIGDIKWAGILRPFWFTINAVGYKLKGEHYRNLITQIQPGDIVIRRFEGYIDKWFIPGFWNHAGLYIGDDGESPQQIVHAVSEGVVQEDILNFMRTDHMLVLRITGKKKSERTASAVESAKSIVGKPYDFGFDFQNSDRFSCTELVSYCYPNLAVGKKMLGKLRVVADDFANSSKLKKIWDSRDETHGPVMSFRYQ